MADTITINKSDFSSKLDNLITGAIRQSQESQDRHDTYSRKFEELRQECVRLKDADHYLTKLREEDLTQIGDLIKDSTNSTIKEVCKEQDSK